MRNKPKYRNNKTRNACELTKELTANAAKNMKNS